jgi:hypothetical protein
LRLKKLQQQVRPEAEQQHAEIVWIAIKGYDTRRTPPQQDLSENEDPQHPPDQKQRNDCAHNMADPLASGLRSAKLKHAAMLALALDERRARQAGHARVDMPPKKLDHG